MIPTWLRDEETPHVILAARGPPKAARFAHFGAKIGGRFFWAV